MNLRKTTALCCFVAVGALTATLAHSEPTGGRGVKIAPATPMPTDADMMQCMMENGTPGEFHKALNHFVGAWDTRLEMWMGGPSAAPQVYTGKAKVEWILDGHYIKEDFTCDMVMDPAAPPTKFKGMGVTGYDNFGGHYTSTWCDNMGTAIGYMRGHANMDGTELIFHGTMDEPSLDTRNKAYMTTHRVLDPNTHVMEMYDMHMGMTNNLVMKITYTRSK